MTARGYELDEAVRRLQAAVRALDLKYGRVRLVDSTTVTYDPTTSGLTATDLQAAIDELAAAVAALVLAAVNVSIADAGNYYAGTNVEAALQELGAAILGAFALDDLTDVVITSPVALDQLRYDGSAWVNDARIWRPLMDGLGNVVTDSGTGEAIMALS